MTDVRVSGESAMEQTADREWLAIIAWLATTVAMLGAASILLSNILAYLV